jgi:hypothetical protein
MTHDPTLPTMPDGLHTFVVDRSHANCSRRSIGRLLGSGLIVLLGLACSDGTGLTLGVELRTDLRPGLEFTSVRTDLEPIGRSEVVSATPSQDFGAGVLIAERSGLEPGAVVVDVVLRDSTGEQVASRRVRLTLSENTVIVVTIASLCVGVTCSAEGDAESTECLAGLCVPPTCLDPAAPGCGSPCASDAECDDIPACATGSCRDGFCLAVARDDACAVGEYCSTTTGCRPRPAPLPDAGTPDAPPTPPRDSGAPDTAPPCTCVDSSAECNDSRTNCELPGSCSALEPCPTSYECSSGMRCVCSEPTVCGVACSSDDGCGTEPGGAPASCDPIHGVCREPRRCLFGAACGPGEVCVGRGNCAVAGSLTEGEACSNDIQCATGLCETGVCLTRCIENAECSAGLQCVAGGREKRGGARCVAPVTGCEACTAGGRFCSGCTTSPCPCGTACRRGSDCPSGDCVISGGSVDAHPLGTCSATSAVCDPEEVYFTSYRYCVREIPCWGDEHCTVGRATSCIWSSPFNPAFGSGLCGHM